MGTVNTFLGEHILLGLDVDFQPGEPEREAVLAFAEIPVLDVPPDAAPTVWKMSQDFCERAVLRYNEYRLFGCLIFHALQGIPWEIREECRE